MLTNTTPDAGTNADASAPPIAHADQKAPTPPTEPPAPHHHRRKVAARPPAATPPATPPPPAAPPPPPSPAKPAAGQLPKGAACHRSAECASGLCAAETCI
jgi:hypothetical protein